MVRCALFSMFLMLAVDYQPCIGFVPSSSSRCNFVKLGTFCVDRNGDDGLLLGEYKYEEYLPSKISMSVTGRQQIVQIPHLTPREKLILARGDRVQKQDRNGCRGSGLVVVDVRASAEEVFETLTRFSMYQDMIPTVRSSNIISEAYSFDPEDSVNTVAEFTLSRFQLKVNVIQKVYREQKTIKFNLDNSRWKYSLPLLMFAR